MRPALWRVRAGEAQAGIAAAGLLAVLFATPWYRATLSQGAFRIFTSATDRTGWQSLSILGPLALVVGILGLAVLVLQIVCRAPALPVCATALGALLSFVLTIGLLVRVLIADPSLTIGRFHAVVDARYGAYLGLVLALAVFVGCYRSLRDDGIAGRDGPQQIETIDLAGLAGPGSAAGEP